MRLFQHNVAVGDWPRGGVVLESLCIERAEVLLVVSSGKVVGFCSLVCGTSVFVHLLPRTVFYNRSKLLNKERSILPMLTATKQNSLWISMKNLLLLFFFFQDVLQSFANTQRTQKLSLYGTCENAIAFMLNRCICRQSWGWRGSVSVWLHKCTLNRKIGYLGCWFGQMNNCKKKKKPQTNQNPKKPKPNPKQLCKSQ